MMPENKSKGHCTTECFQVQAKVMNAIGPQVFNNQIFDNNWRTVQFTKSLIGVPNKLYALEAARQGYYTYEAAMALAYWFASEVDMSALDIRLMQYSFVYDYSVSEVGALEPIEHGGIAAQKRFLKPEEAK